MTPVTRPRGPLPARVYWTRRLVLVAVAFALVFGVARLLGSGGGSGGGPSAQPVGADASTPAVAGTTAGSPVSPSATTTRRPGSTATRPAGKAAPSVLASPAGACRDEDVVATPSVRGHAYAGRPVVFDLTLVTGTTPACTWTVSASSLVVKVTSGSDRIWSTQQCTGAVLKQSVVVRKDVPVAVTVVWNGQRSDAGCTRTTSWAGTGYYHVVAAAFGADPVDEQFRLEQPVRETKTVTATPTPDADASRAAAGRKQPGRR
jgi:hypothetical protein